MEMDGDVAWRPRRRRPPAGGGMGAADGAAAGAADGAEGSVMGERRSDTTGGLAGDRLEPVQGWIRGSLGDGTS